jgi:hypothetical protein
MTDLVQFLDRGLDGRDLTLLKAVDDIVDAGYLRDHVVGMLRDGVSGSLGGAAAYLHPNGFVKIRVATRPGEWSVRLHLWNQSEEESHAHSHRWDFASRLLIGSLSTKKYEITSGAGGYTTFFCRRTQEDGYLLEDRGPCTIYLCDAQTHHRGKSYFQDHQFLHTVATATVPPIVTAVVQGSDVADYSVVVAKAGDEPPKQLPVLRLEPSQTASLLEQALDLL